MEEAIADVDSAAGFQYRPAVHAVRVLHVDEDLVIVDKPAGVLAVPAPRRSGATVMDLVERQIGKRVQAVHRLDEDTSGVFVLALTERGRVGMEDLFRRHEVEREYLALLTGTPSPAAGTVRSQVRDEGGVVRVVERGGQPAITHYESLGRRGRC